MEMVNNFEIPHDNKGISGYALRKKSSIIVNDVRIHPYFVVASPGMVNVRSEACFPILGKEDILLGILDCQSNYKNAFSPEDGKFLEMVALRLAVVIELYDLF